MSAVRPWCIVLAFVALSHGCDDKRRSDPGVAVAADCRRAFGEKLGVRFVRICPSDLPGVITAPLWIAAAPVGCSVGARKGCPITVALAPTPSGAVEPTTAQMVDAALAHRTCSLRFGGRLPTVAERAQAQEALGLVTLVVTEGETPASLDLHALPEWTTTAPCLEPSTLGGCTPVTFPTDSAWAEVERNRLRSCTASPAPTAGALVISVGETCPGTADVRCVVVAAASGSAARAGFALTCRAVSSEPTPPAPPTNVAGFRCVVPEATLAGTTSDSP